MSCCQTSLGVAYLSMSVYKDHKAKSRPVARTSVMTRQCCQKSLGVAYLGMSVYKTKAVPSRGARLIATRVANLCMSIHKDYSFLKQVCQDLLL